jgi:hypothetical protein
MPPRKSSRALGLQRQDPGKEFQAGRVDERHEVRLVAVRLRLLAVVERCRGIVSVPLLTRRCEAGQMMPTSRIQEVPLSP